MQTTSVTEAASPRRSGARGTRLLRLSKEEHWLLFTIHYIVFDGWSLGVLLRELTVLYEAFHTGKPSPLPDLPIQYADFAYWQRNWLQGDILKSLLTYWKQKLIASPPPLDLPIAQPRPNFQMYRDAIQLFVLPKTLTDALKALSRREGATLFMTLLAAFQTVLHRCTDQEDILVGSQVANRNWVEFEGIIGLFVNWLVLRTDFSGNPTFRQLLARVRQMTLEAYMHQELPYTKLVEALQPKPDLSRSPLFRMYFVLQNFPMPVLDLPGLTLNLLEIDTGVANRDLTLVMNESAEGLTGYLQYFTDLFDATKITQISEDFQALLESIVADPDQHLSNLLLSNKK